jgi:predicted nucleotidyltransferase
VSGLAVIRFRDRDAPIASEGLVFRTYGYDHPPRGCFCDLEYASDTVYATNDPRALREGPNNRYFKFYFDGGLRFTKDHFPQYQIKHKALNRCLVGAPVDLVDKIVRPDERLRFILGKEVDPLTESLRQVIELVTDNSNLRIRDFGVFGSISHGFHNPMYSDIDLIVYGKKELGELRKTLFELYEGKLIKNEYEEWTPDMPPRNWGYNRYSKEEYGWHQKRKLIYSIFLSDALNRAVKVEFEPVRKWSEIENEYHKTIQIKKLGRVEARVEVTEEEAGFMPSIYHVDLKEIDRNIHPKDLTRVVSYMEEFRLQLRNGEDGLVVGELEMVETQDELFYQIALSRSIGYFSQVLKLP